MTTFYWRDEFKGWFQPTKNGRWRALSPAGTLTHHDSSLAAMEALLCSA
jgi:hypothetical protein